MKTFNTSFEFEFETEEFGTVSCLARVQPGELQSWESPEVPDTIDFIEFTTLIDGIEVHPDLTEVVRAEAQAMSEWEDRCYDLNCGYDED